MFEHLLAGVDSGTPSQKPFGCASPQLRQGVVLAATCRQWTLAAVQAAAAVELVSQLHVPADCPPHVLSELVGQLSAGANIQLEYPALAAATVPAFLEAAQPRLVSAAGPAAASRAVGIVFSGCASVRRLRCDGGLVPKHFPPNLYQLGMIYPPDCQAEQQATRLLQASTLLLELRHLILRFNCTDVRLTCQAVHLRSLRPLTIQFTVPQTPATYLFSGLEAAATLGIAIDLQVSVHICICPKLAAAVESCRTAACAWAN